MSKQPWLAHYPSSVPKTIDPDKYKNIPELLADSTAKYPNNPSYENMGKVISYQELHQLSDQLAAYFQNVLKLKKGDKIAIQMPNVLQNPITIHAALKAGLVVVNTNPLYTPSEMKHQFTDSGVKAIVILSNFAYNLEKIISETSIEHVIVTDVGDLIGGLKGAIVNFVVRYIKRMVPSYSLHGAIRFNDALASGAQLSFVRPK